MSGDFTPPTIQETNPYLAHFDAHTYVSSGVSQRRRGGLGFQRHLGGRGNGSRGGWRGGSRGDRFNHRGNSSSGPGFGHGRGRGGNQSGKHFAPSTFGRFPYGNYDQYYGYRNPGEAGSFAVARLEPRLGHVLGPLALWQGEGGAAATEEFFRSAVERNWFKGKRILDVGCNAGGMTVPIALLFEPAQIEGVDVDPTLVYKARRYANYVYSLIEPTPSSSPPNGDENMEAGVESEMDGRAPELEHFPVSCVGSMGLVPIVRIPEFHSSDLEDAPADTDMHEDVSHSSKKPATSRFPANLSFRAADWATEPDPRITQWRDTSNGAEEKEIDDESGDAKWDDEPSYDVILGLSVTKWIHLRHGDTGLRRFFHRCYAALEPGGVLILEPQEWKSYTKAVGVMGEVARSNYPTLELRPDDFERALLEDVGFARAEVLWGRGGGDGKGFERTISAYFK
ncbi:Bin3-domain-containing protein [Gonapodya prolifera JEL478]|uniref:RNA methyltransferase n=1 Tax=Gonapodya prolifera (strain JEL478) TaxID=1344416 RepID=A0A138ZY19_GONPJ|nr:Bin3-domain-containing protein [Gonapodya prolifera JEL478]|eukprot:KXS09351.1 Bin3-domain-containing protein [Gonapodya prolifera JEL478]